MKEERWGKRDKNGKRMAMTSPELIQAESKVGVVEGWST
jgi:hypothetical protein